MNETQPLGNDVDKVSSTKQPKSSALKSALLILGPIVAIIVALVIYFTGGRTVSENDSYVGAPNVTIVPQVSGRVTKVEVGENEPVLANSTLFQIDPDLYRFALDQAKAQVQAAKEKLAGLSLTYQQNLAAVKQAEADVVYAQGEYDRSQQLLKDGVGTTQASDAARRQLQVAQDQRIAAQDAASSTLALLGGSAEIPIEQQSDYLQAMAIQEKAEWDLRQTTVVAPFSGIATQVDNIQVGTFLQPGQAAFTLVSADSWIDANIKETDLAHVKIGDAVDIVVDNYPDLQLKGRVASISPASGSVFSLLPPQNASGNWVKVVQRIPVRITIHNRPEDIILRVGSSANVTIQTNYRRTLQTLVDDLASIVNL
ncbi:HlyD family secretion protein [Ochrobactrum chromiisoli]|uniref:HlyD family secretion protein n=1 Tax=Ochrobactrum chromiisoli TaxID=2993941 RepID=A0ABT3QUX3_9HYPH|nr:HlyD family secretion protein [Ochrobactrum chromiisoli]MCX2699426.1 HlyD family secretion protein [Ochrobactrum chromiisoli]